jgi:hypothetical protein
MSKISELFKLADLITNKYAKSSESQFVYHIKNKNFKGENIIPLSEMENIYPSTYKEQIKKYKGRESHPETKIKILNCKWKDCVNFSTLNPIKIFQLKELLGIPGYKNDENIEIFKFDIKIFENYDFCLYDDNKNPKKDDAYKEISIASYKEEKFIPTETVKYFAECKEENEYPLLFGNILHILVKGNIPISKAEIIKFENNL